MGSPEKGQMNSDLVIQTENLTKRYGTLAAVNEVSLHVRKGEIYGFLGLNGAGKTTAIRLLLGLTRPTSGKAFLEGKQILPGRPGPWKRVGYMVEMPYAYPELSVRENLQVMAKLRHLEAPQAIPHIIEQLHLGAYQYIKARNLSLGNAQRLGLAKALLHDPEILILDEPTNGLDPAGIVEIRELLKKLARDRGVTIFISSHILGEIAKLASRIGIIHEGRLVQEIDIKELHTLRQKRLILEFRDSQKGGQILQNLGWEVLPGQAGQWEIRQNKAIQYPDELVVALVKEGCPPLRLQITEEDLESYFLRIIYQSE